MSIIKNGFCSKLTDEFDNRMDQLSAVESKLDDKLRSLTIGLAGILGWSPQEALDKFSQNIAKNTDNLIPPLDEYDELVDLINACSFTKNDAMLSQPSTLSRAFKNEIKSNSSQLLSTLASGIPSEFSASNLVDALKDQAKTAKVDIITPESLKILDCISAICGKDITARAARLQGFLSKYNFKGNGELDTTALLESQGIGSAQIQAIEQVNNQVDGMMSKIDDSVAAGTSFLKGITPFF